MTDEGANPVYYVISDLHIGGDEQLEEVDFLDELLALLERLERKTEDVELIINGDAFGLWEFTELEGPAKFDELLERYPTLFEQFRATGERIKITLLPGNHDHELAAYDEYAQRLAGYNIDLECAESMTRPIGDRVIYFEHGHQQDPNNRIEDFGNPYVTPIGYYYNTHVTSRAGQLSERGRFNWLKDIQAVTPTERVPSWLVSKYVYREMNPLLRYALIPFLLLVNVSFLLAVLAGLDLAGVWEMPLGPIRSFFGQYGLAGRGIYVFFWLNMTIAGLLLLVAIPLRFFIRDARKTIDRFGIFETPVTVSPEEPYKAAASEVFAEHPETAIYCYGHTHRAEVTEHENRLLVNSGTWLKRLHRREVIAGRLPPVFYPSYELTAVRITTEGENIVVDYEEIKKPSPHGDELTLTERLLTFGRVPDPTLPERSVVPATFPEESDDTE
jgi:UDP-2,3-diacylglucosamine pyrophosphatase LpxH